MSKVNGPEDAQGIAARGVVEDIAEAEGMEVVEAVEVAEAIEAVEEGETSGRAQVQELEEASEAAERKKYYQEKLKQINQRIRQDATLL